MNKSRKQEIVIYCLLWAAIFIAPTLTHYIQSVLSNDNMDWMFLRQTWINTLLFFILFWVHDLFIAPLLFHRGGRKQYILYVFIALLVYGATQMMSSSRHRPPDEGMTPPNMGTHAGSPPPRPTPMNPDILVHILVAMTMCGANVGTKFYFKSLRDEADNMERERQNLNKEIEFLTYQISPHFFMNTLNNIHALIDIDPEKAKSTIIELSRMMRYALYDGREEAVSLQKEIDFLNHYIALMRLRYTDNVDIKTDFDEAEETAMVPPLLLVTFVENAFKHGISYRSASYIHIKISTNNGVLTFSCINSVPKKTHSDHHGIGLDNVKERLKLIYNTGFQLIIDNQRDTFSVLLTIPTNQNDKMYSNG